jgi:putative ABC transport system permease protein
MYIYRENIILTILGIALGQLLGRYLCEYLIRTIEIDLAMFGREAQPQNYLGSIALSLVFALLVNFIMFFRMKKIDMVESLKSVE